VRACEYLFASAFLFCEFVSISVSVCALNTVAGVYEYCILSLAGVPVYIQQTVHTSQMYKFDTVAGVSVYAVRSTNRVAGVSVQLKLDSKKKDRSRCPCMLYNAHTAKL
jgi:hypothetical protein